MTCSLCGEVNETTNSDIFYHFFTKLSVFKLELLLTQKKWLEADLETSNPVGATKVARRLSAQSPWPSSPEDKTAAY
jgi:hypothetical protein